MAGPRRAAAAAVPTTTWQHKTPAMVGHGQHDGAAAGHPSAHAHESDDRDFSGRHALDAKFPAGPALPHATAPGQCTEYCNLLNNCGARDGRRGGGELSATRSDVVTRALATHHVSAVAAGGRRVSGGRPVTVERLTLCTVWSLSRGCCRPIRSRCAATRRTRDGKTLRSRRWRACAVCVPHGNTVVECLVMTVRVTEPEILAGEWWIAVWRWAGGINPCWCYRRSPVHLV
jgi:hypothetical protein